MTLAKRRVITFASKNQTGVINEDGTDEKYLVFSVPGQVRWSLGPIFHDHRRIIATSYEDVTIANVVAGSVLTHTWVYDLVSGSLAELLKHGRLASFTYCHSILPGEQRIGVNAVIDGEERIFTMDLDGSHQVEVTKGGEGFCYGVGLNPEGNRLAFHVTGSKFVDKRQPLWFNPGHYSINTIGLTGEDRLLVAGSPEHLYFGPGWSPDGQWLVYLDCLCEQDPAHFWADICIGRADGSEYKQITTRQSHWFGTTFGTKESRGGGSNISRWTPDGKYVTYTRVAPGSHPDCEYHPDLPDHCECVYNPKMARGGCQVCLLNPFTGEVKEVTHFEEGKWDFRPACSSEGDKLVFTRARVDQVSELWVVDFDGKNEQRLSIGVEGKGADFGRWLEINE